MNQKEKKIEKTLSPLLPHFKKLAPSQVLGLATLFGISLSEKDGEQIILEILENYLKLSKKQQKKVLHLIKEAANGNGTKPKS